MLRVTDLDASIKYYTEALGCKLLRKKDNPEYKYTLAFLGYGPEEESTVFELTYNWCPPAAVKIFVGVVTIFYILLFISLAIRCGIRDRNFVCELNCKVRTPAFIIALWRNVHMLAVEDEASEENVHCV